MKVALVRVARVVSGSHVRVLVAMTALFVSPLGYFATLALSPVTAGAAKALFWAA